MSRVYMLRWLVIVVTLVIITLYHQYDVLTARHLLPAAPTQQVSDRLSSAQCNVTKFLSSLSLGEMPLVARELLADCERVLYNRVSKCASRTMAQVFQVTGQQHNIPTRLVDQEFTLHDQLREEYMKNMSDMGHRFIITSHFYWDNFTGFYGDSLVFINIIRDPVDWFVSFIYWQKYGSLSDNKLAGRQTQTKATRQRETARINQEISACISDSDCVAVYIKKFSARRFLCGQEPFCKMPTSRSLDAAVDHVYNKYLVVGLYEDLPGFLEVLEFVLPHVFTNVTHTFHQIAGAAETETRTIRKYPLSFRARNSLKAQFKMEYVLYNTVKKRFYELLHAIRRIKNDISR